jgi:uncharacterized protein
MPATPKPCPVCKAAAADGFRPFCSKRCADIDLGRWFASSYVVAGGDDDAQGDPASGGGENAGDD